MISIRGGLLTRGNRVVEQLPQRQLEKASLDGLIINVIFFLVIEVGFVYLLVLAELLKLKLWTQ